MKRLLIIFILIFPIIGLTQELDNSKKFTFGINYDVSELLRIKIEPILNYSNSPVKDAPINESLQNVGLNFGLGFKIK
jgi:hypothetical protein